MKTLLSHFRPAAAIVTLCSSMLSPSLLADPKDKVLENTTLCILAGPLEKTADATFPEALRALLAPLEIVVPGRSSKPVAVPVALLERLEAPAPQTFAFPEVQKPWNRFRWTAVDRRLAVLEKLESVAVGPGFAGVWESVSFDNAVEARVAALASAGEVSTLLVYHLAAKQNKVPVKIAGKDGSSLTTWSPCGMSLRPSSVRTQKKTLPQIPPESSPQSTTRSLSGSQTEGMPRSWRRQRQTCTRRGASWPRASGQPSPSLHRPAHPWVQYSRGQADSGARSGIPPEGLSRSRRTKLRDRAQSSHRCGWGHP